MPVELPNLTLAPRGGRMRIRNCWPAAVAAGAVFSACAPSQDSPLAPDLSVISVTITPTPDTVRVGASVQLTATIVASGNGTRTATWNSSVAGIASVTSAGMVRGVGAGAAVVIASSGGKADTALVTVLDTATTPDTTTTPPPPPSGGAWPNEPAGFTVASDEPFNSLTEGGWNSVQRQGTNGSGLFPGLDATAPNSPAGVLQFTFATGFVAGSEPGVEYYDLASPAKETYFAFWWKPSSPWQNNSNSNVNKIAFLFPSGGDIYIMMQGIGAGYQLAVEPEFSGDVRVLPPNVTATPVGLGQWHLVEWYVKYATSGSSADGVTKWWMDGVLQGSYANLQTPGDAGFTEYQLAPTWGGVVGTKSESDFYLIDHARISRR